MNQPPAGILLTIGILFVVCAAMILVFQRQLTRRSKLYYGRIFGQQFARFITVWNFRALATVILLLAGGMVAGGITIALHGG